MDEPRQSSPGAGAGFRRLVPPPALCGFLLLLALMFTVSYVVGAAAGPVAPGMHGDIGDSGGSGGADSDDMGTMDADDMDAGDTGGPLGAGH
ncbi:hypothetical protein F7R91_14925 [Streptomyces luteolifulvus]|uniref:Secreted protein n=1 Tax=Streptomyces luteolifulvus TaxID=2615112 RepID=A0A6H9V1R9_9ACTN|nr:hypothetical protein [Streptomyces luteolifulvus]KAB1146865.1 hypothetical protein F7R91_14925 [Streptomyces luteolifulvus]